MKPALTTRIIAQALMVTPQTVRRMCRRGVFRPIKLSSRTLRIPAEQLEALLQQPADAVGEEKDA